MHRYFENSRNPFLRKGEAVGARGIKGGLRRLRPDHFPPLPPLLVNSFPKSGTHLLSQIVAGLPSDWDWGEFYISAPSLTMREVAPQKMSPRLRRLTPAESAKGHLFWSRQYADQLGELGVVTYFIYRDPRDVVVSEAHYLAESNKWHRLHRDYAKLPGIDEQIMLSIRGDEALTAQGLFCLDVGQRFERYRGWLSEPRVLPVRFEDLRGEARPDMVERVVRHYVSALPAGAAELDVAALRERCLANIDPTRSHTFREGKQGGWRTAFNQDHKDAFKAVAGQLLIDLGYESSLDW